jgi:formate dehydrogenase iron-sulfur subunit
MEISRRNFLKVSAGAAGATGLALLHRAEPVMARSNQTQAGVAMLIDVNKCINCWWCYAACKNYNGLPETIKPDPADPPLLSPATWTSLYPVNKEDRWISRKIACNHCTEAACVQVCPTGALSYNEMGFVQYDREKCSGCGYCAEFCPFEIPKMDRNAVTGDAVMEKCTFCFDRVTNGEPPACAAACTTGAIQFGQRSELITAGEARLAEIRASNPDAVLYGVNDLCGLHVMYVLDDKPEVYGLPEEPVISGAVITRDVFRWFGLGSAIAAIAGFGLNYLISRKRMKKREEESD